MDTGDNYKHTENNNQFTMSFWKCPQFPHENLGEFSEAKVDIRQKILKTFEHLWSEVASNNNSPSIKSILTYSLKQNFN